MIPVRPAPRPNGWLVWCGSRIGWWFPSPVVSLSCRPSSHLRSGVGQGVHLLGVSSERCGAVSGLSRVGKHKNNDNNTKKSKNNHRHHHHHHQSPNDRVFRPSQNSPLRKTTNTPPSGNSCCCCKTCRSIRRQKCASGVVGAFSAHRRRSFRPVAYASGAGQAVPMRDAKGSLTSTPLILIPSIFLMACEPRAKLA